MEKPLIIEPDEPAPIASNHICGSCGDPIHFQDEVFLIRIVQAQVVQGPKLEYYDVLDEDGDAAYEPYFFDFGCWENIEEDTRTLCEDYPPMSDDYSIIECDFCGSDIRAWEIFGLVCLGEMTVSVRQSSGSQEIVSEFDSQDSDRHVCVACINKMNSHVIALWRDFNEPIPGIFTCTTGLRTRCWRANDCECKQLNRIGCKSELDKEMEGRI